MKTLIAALIAALILPACGTSTCQQPAHVNDLQCITITSVVDCTTPAAIQAVTEFAPVVLTLIQRLTGADGTIDWAALETALSTLGLGDASCILTSIAETLAKPAAVKPTSLVTIKAYNDGFAAWRRIHLAPNAKIRVKGSRLLYGE